MKNKQHSNLRAAYSFYNVSTVTPWKSLIQDMLIMAHQVSCVVILLFIMIVLLRVSFSFSINKQAAISRLRKIANNGIQ